MTKPTTLVLNPLEAVTVFTALDMLGSRATDDALKFLTEGDMPRFNGAVQGGEITLRLINQIEEQAGGGFDTLAELAFAAEAQAEAATTQAKAA